MYIFFFLLKVQFILFCSHSIRNGDLFTCEDNMLFSRVKISHVFLQQFFFKTVVLLQQFLLLSFQGNFLLNNHCVPCDHCRKGEFVVEECSPKQNTLCRKLLKTSCPSSSHVNSQEPVTGTKPVGGGTVHIV